MRAKTAIFMVAVLLVSLWATRAYADILPLPHTFYGSLTINGSPALPGTEVKAMGNNVMVGIPGNPLLTTVVGQYGSSIVGEVKLIVQGDIHPLTTIRFYVNGVDTGRTYEFHESWNTNLDLTLLRGDANGDGNINSIDITKVERIIVHLDAPTYGADATGDSYINANDITKVERLIAGLTD